MTTIVKVEAHCNDGKEVIVQTIHGQFWHSEVLQDGESTSLYVYDTKKILVFEAQKPGEEGQA